MKIFYQEICDLKYKWDEKLPSELTAKWDVILKELCEIDCIELDRNYCFDEPIDPIKTVQIHGFSDASEKMVAASIYVRFQLESGKTKTALVISRNRIVSSQAKKSKKMSIPRAELNALLLLSELCPMVEQNLKKVFKIESVFYWTDSAMYHTYMGQ